MNSISHVDTRTDAAVSFDAVLQEDIDVSVLTNLTVERVREMLHYDPSTGVFTWKVRPTGKSRRRVGDNAGTVKTINGRPQLYVGIDGRGFIAGRLAWFYTHGEWPAGRIGYINGNSSDIRIANLKILLGIDGETFDHRTPEGRSAYSRAHRAAHRDHYREIDLKRDFNIGLAEYQRLFVEQNGVCAICQKPETDTRKGKTKWLAVDHDHETGAVRGLLCVACNTGLGKFVDSVERMTSAIAYLKRYAKTESDAPSNVVSLTSKKDST